MRALENSMITQPVPHTVWRSGRYEEVTHQRKVFPSAEVQNRFYELRNERYGLWNNRSIPATLPRGTILRVDRIYIRKGNEDYSSLSFYITETAHAALQPVKTKKGFKKGRKRFWAKLAEVNTLRVEHVQPVAEVAA
ncbi:hypothetical protein CC53_gp131 [Rhizobium phage vB_RleS_L338C]|uniref:hypothetical protein n=1 Tax=Rhizobium phage vB_RleS_L338C TaxID=1414737 RepID=UPI0003D95A23|nr:hypothetical protein CC53_gp131 [Rhizobium phage vB_RleS_L338C]AHC30548.1 hypothetical protein L338C_131 [Rhizobium phage vB_RleS_L338C]